MKIKSKLILAATSLLVLSGVAAGTSTYAWYTANRQVSLGITNISAEAQLTSLDMSYDPTLNTRNSAEEGSEGVDPFTNTTADDSNAFSGSFTKKLTDVSSQGDHNFVKPIFGADDSVDPTEWWDDEDDYLSAPTNANGDVFFHRFVFTFTASGEDDVALYLSPKSTVTDTDPSPVDETLSVADAVRMSFSATTDDTEVGSADTEMIYANPNGSGESNYLADENDFEEDAVDNSSGFGILEENGTDGFFDRETNYTESEFFYGDGETGSGTQDTKFNDSSTGFLAELDSTNDTVYVTVDIWIEGTDDDCVVDPDEDFYDAFDVSLEFYELNKSSMYDSGSTGV